MEKQDMLGNSRGRFGLGIIFLLGIVAVVGVGGGITAIIWNSVVPLKTQILGNSVSGGNIGIVCVFIALILLAAVARSAHHAVLSMREVSNWID